MNSAQPATPVNKEAIRILVQDHGYAEASRISGFREDRIRQWAHRGQWFTQAKPHATVAKSSRVTNVTSLGEAHAEALREHGEATRMSLARAARRLAGQSEKANLRESGAVLSVAKTASATFGWDSDKATNQFTLNVLNINSLSVDQD